MGLQRSLAAALFPFLAKEDVEIPQTGTVASNVTPRSTTPAPQAPVFQSQPVEEPISVPDVQPVDETADAVPQNTVNSPDVQGSPQYIPANPLPTPEVAPPEPKSASLTRPSGNMMLSIRRIKITV